MATYAYCEPAIGGTYRTIHIRRLNATGLKLGGGIGRGAAGSDTGPLCGHEWTFGGWDLEQPVVLAEATENAERTNPGGQPDTCPKCVAALTAETES